jgi:hypothetical protein
MSSDSSVPDSAPLDWNLEPESTTRLVEAIGKKWILFGSHLRTDGILSIERKMIVAFHTNTLGVRGSETAVWDYANFNETILGNRSVLCLREGLCEKAIQPKQFEVFFRKAADVLFHPADQNETGKARGLTE